MKVGLLLLIGIPGSGKTTLAKTLINNYQNHDTTAFHFIHVSYDELIPVENQTCRGFEWKLARNSLSSKIEKLIVSVKNRDVDGCPDEFKNQLQSVKLWESNFVLILDDNMYFKSMRYSLFQIARKQGVGFCQVYINCPLQCALLRNSLRSPKCIIPPYVIENMYEKIEPPNCKNNWEKYSLELDAYIDLLEINFKLLPVLNNSLDDFFCEKDDSESELSKLQCKKSVLHQTDIALRRVIGSRIKKCIAEYPKQKHQEFIDGLNVRKAEILSDIKAGNICLPNDVLQEVESDAAHKFNLIEFLDGYF